MWAIAWYVCHTTSQHDSYQLPTGVGMGFYTLLAAHSIRLSEVDVSLDPGLTFVDLSGLSDIPLLMPRIRLGILIPLPSLCV